MSEILFLITSLGMLSWLLMIFFPKWNLTDWIVRTAVFPIGLSLCYVIGLVGFIALNGAGFAIDFASFEGVVKLLQNPDLAIVAWIHLLAFDQLVGRMIFMENREERILPLPMQSVFMFLCLMFGPLGYLLYVLSKGLFSKHKV